MCGNVEIAKSVFKNSQMGIEAISTLVKIVKDDKMLEELYSELGEYKRINERAHDTLLGLGQQKNKRTSPRYPSGARATAGKH